MTNLEKLLALDKDLRWREWPENKPENKEQVLAFVPAQGECGIFDMFDGRYLEANDYFINGREREPDRYFDSERLYWIPLAPLLKYLEEKEK